MLVLEPFPQSPLAMMKPDPQEEVTFSCTITLKLTTNIIMDEKIAAAFGHFLPIWNGHLYGWHLPTFMSILI
jgi:hypothetical protein